VTTFQVAGVALAASFALVSLVSTLRHWIGRRSGLSWVTLWVLAGVAIAFPDITVIVARALGIARGADLVFYCAILGMFIGFFAVYVRIRQIERNITLLVRRIALDGAPAPDEGEPAPPPTREPVA
jgi:hypothetical protein